VSSFAIPTSPSLPHKSIAISTPGCPPPTKELQDQEMATTFAMPPIRGRDVLQTLFPQPSMATRFDIGTSLAQEVSPHITPSTESTCGPSSTEDLQGSTPIIQEWKVAHDCFWYMLVWLHPTNV
jgi:hypothetical protein